MNGFLRPKVGLALGGGGARGLAHLGVLRVLEKEGIPVDLIAGTSMGALVGALFALYRSTREAEARVRDFVSSPQFHTQTFQDLVEMTPLTPEKQGFFSAINQVYKLGLFFATTAFRPSFIDAGLFEADISRIVPDCRIEDAPIPLALVATDLRAGGEVVLRSGPIRAGVMASSAIAGVLPPVQLDGRELVDGGFVNVLPVETAFKMGADIVIAVDVSTDVADSREFIRTGNAISVRATAILSEAHKNLLLRFADVVIHPDVGGVHWAEFAALDRIQPLGERAALDAMPRIRAALLKGRWRRLRSLLAGRRWSINLME